jgi:hypothetical protein
VSGECVGGRGSGIGVGGEDGERVSEKGQKE